MMKLLIIFCLGFLPVACTTLTKAPAPSCNEDICYTSNPAGRIKSVVYGKRRLPLLVKDIIWVPTEVTKNHVTQGHIEFELMSADGGPK